MASSRKTVLRYIRRLASTPETDQVSDAALLDRFVAEQDQRAFTALVQRHGAMVLQVCRWVLGNADDAEDAFQGTFLVLARKAAAVPREALAAWLHGVARRVALETRAARFRYHESGPLLEAPADGRADPLAELSARELLTIIDEEIQRLPQRYRLPLILCCLGGRSLEEAARQLGWTSGSVKGRLERGRARLHARLVRRGLTLSVALAAVEASRATASATVLAGLVVRTVPGALAFGADQTMVTGVSQSAVALAGRVVKAMALPRLTMMAALLLTTAVVGAGIALHRKSPEPAPRAQGPSPRVDLAALQDPVRDSPGPFWDQSDVPMEVKGQVLDPHGKPLPGAELYVGYAVRRFASYSVRRFAGQHPESVWRGQSRPEPYLRRATTGADGRFHFRFATAELDPSVLDDARPAVMAIAAGYGPRWAEIGPFIKGELKLKLVDDFPVSGRVLDADRHPVAGAKLVVQAIYSAPVDELSRFLKGNTDGWAPRCWKGRLPGNAPTIVTDTEGRWRCGGLGRDRIVTFALDGSGVPRTFLNVTARPWEETVRVTDVHGPAFDYLAPRVRTIRGTVRDRATGKPIAGVTVRVLHGNATVRTGPDGRFELLHHAVEVGYGLVAEPEAGQGYFAGQTCVFEKAGAAELTQDLFLERGIVLSGLVVNHSTGKPPKTALVEYYPLASNPYSHRVICRSMIPASTATVRPDGSYTLVVLPGPGLLAVVASPREDYAVADVMNKEWAKFMRQRSGASPDKTSDPDIYVPIRVETGQPGDLPITKYHALALIHPPEDARNWVLNLPLQTAQTLRGTVLGPGGQPLTGVEVVGLSALRESEMLEGASFTVTGLNPQGNRKLLFQHHGKKVGKVVTIRANAAQPVTIKLEPCGTVKGRLVDERGHLVPGVPVILCGDAGYETTRTDKLGRFEMALFPGQKYAWGGTRKLSTEFGTVQVAAGQVRDLGDLIQKSAAGGQK